MFFPKFVYMTKNRPFFPILHVFAPLNDVRAYSAWSWKTTLLTWIFGRAWYPPWHSSGPPGVPFLFFLYRSCLWICWLNPLYFWCKEGCQLWYMGPLQVQNQDRLLPLLNFRKNRLNDYMGNSQPTEIENTLLSWGNEMRKKNSFPYIALANRLV